MGIITRNRKLFLFLVPASLFTLLIWLWRCSRRTSIWAPTSKDAASSSSGDVTKEISIAGQMVGFVIGRQGSKVKELEAQTNTKIRFREVNDGKVAMVTGQPDRVEKAIEAIQMLLKEKNEKKQVKRVELVIPSHAIGRLIGRQGCNIVAMQKESGARINVDRGSGTTRLCTITGSNDQVTRGVALVEQSLAESQASLHRSNLNKKLRDDNSRKYGDQWAQKSVHKHHQSDPIQLAPPTLPSGSDFFPAVVSHVTQDGHVWIQPISDGADALNNLCDVMTDLYSKMTSTDKQLMEPVIGSCCAAPFTVDGQWYRAQVISIKSAAAVQLLYVDYGDTEWHPMASLKVLFPQFCTLPIQATECELGGVAMPAGGWNNEAIQLIEDVTMCARWDPVMVKVLDHSCKPPLVTIVNTSGDQDVDVSCKLNQLIQFPDQDQPVCEEPITMEQASQLESNMFGDMENAPTHLYDQTGQDDHPRLPRDQESGQDHDQQNGVIHLQFLNSEDDQQNSQHNDQDGQSGQNVVIHANQENGQHNQGYEVQAVNITFESSDSDDNDHVIVEYEEGGVVTSTSWMLHTPNV